MNGATQTLSAVQQLAAQIRGEVDAMLPRYEETADLKRLRRCDRPPLPTGYRWETKRKKKARRGLLPIPQPQPGEITLGRFLDAETTRCGVSRPVVYGRVMSGKYPGLKIRKARERFIFVTVPEGALMMTNVTQPGEMTMKEFVAGEAARNGESESAVYARMERKGYPDLMFRRVNRRVVFVKRK